MMDDPSMDYETLTGTKSQARIDQENLNLLATLHYVLGGITALGSCVFIFHIVMGLTMVHNPAAFSGPPSASRPTDAFPPEMGYMFAAMGTVAVLGGWTLGALTAFAGKCITARKNYIYILVIAGINCAFIMPLGTALGVFTFVVLLRPTVKAMFPRA